MTKTKGKKKKKSPCSKKVYRDEVSAMLILAKIKHKDSPKRSKQESRVYYCKKCSGYHLTSKP